jgi:ornithine decarboxylase
MAPHSPSIRTISDLSAIDLVKPTYVFRPHSLDNAYRLFSEQFGARILYAVKTNPSTVVLTRLNQLGVQSFDVASIHEIELIHRLCPGSTLFYMHPVKARHDIRQAYFDYGVRHFSLDSEHELQKIWEETGKARDLCLHVRLAIPNAYAEMNLSDKFGAVLEKANTLLIDASQKARSLGISFHVGSQCMHPDAYRVAIHMAHQVIDTVKIKVDYFNVGGGFPSLYPGLTPPPIEDFFNVIEEEFASINQDYELLAEPGRALVSECMSLIVRVELRKDNTLYINDGTYGGLFDAGTPHFIFPTRMIGASETDNLSLTPFSFYGPTCDSLDFMKGPFYLPSTISEGNYIEIGQLGAYSRSLATRFNGFSHNNKCVWVNDPPLMSMYEKAMVDVGALEVIAA